MDEVDLERTLDQLREALGDPYRVEEQGLPTGQLQDHVIELVGDLVLALGDMVVTVEHGVQRPDGTVSPLPGPGQVRNVLVAYGAGQATHVVRQVACGPWQQPTPPTPTPHTVDGPPPEVVQAAKDAYDQHPTP